MKKFILILINLLQSVVISQNIKNSKILDIKISDNSYSSTIIQKNVRLYPYLNNGFIAIWKDLRNGVDANFAQSFDSLGNRIGENFEIFGDRLVKLNNESFLSIKGTYFDDAIGAGSYGESAKIIDNKGLCSEQINLGWINIPECGTGYFGYYFTILPLTNSFLAFYVEQSNYQFFKYNFTGDLLYSSQNQSDYYLTYYPEIATTVSPSDKYLVSYFSLYDPDSIGVFINIYDESDSLVVKNLEVKKYYYSEDYYDRYWEKYYHQHFKIHASTFVDSIYSIAWADLDSSKLFLYNYTETGSFISKDEVLLSAPSSNYTQILKFYKLDDFENKLLLTIDYGEGKDSNLVDYTIFINDSLSIDKVIQSEKRTYKQNIEHSLIKTEEGKGFYSKTIDEDVYLINYYDTLDTKIKLNDDKLGSNENNQTITKAGDESFFVTYSNEKKHYGKQIDSFGNVLNTLEIDENDKYIFFDNGRAVKLWKTKLEDRSGIFGFSYLNENLEIEKEVEVGFKSNFWAISHSAFLTSKDKIYYSYQKDNQIVFTIINCLGLIEKKQFITIDSNISYYKIYPPGDNYFWLETDYHKFQKYSFNLDTLSTQFELNGIIQYVGNDIFIKRSCQGNDFYCYYSAINPVDDSIYIQLDKISELSSPVFHSVDNFSFIVIEDIIDLTCTTYLKTDFSVENSIQIHNNVSSKKINPSFAINGEKVMFVWQDNRNEGLGFDIYCSIFNLDEITDIDDEKTNNVNRLPTEFSLEQNYPNPFNPSTTIKYEIPAQNIAGMTNLVQLIVYDVLGNEITTLVNEYQSQGSYSVEFDASSIPSGVYFYRLNYGDKSITNKMLLVK